MTAERLQKVLASAGIASRRDCEGMIAAGRVTVNGRVIQEPGTRVDLNDDVVEVDGQPVRKPTSRTYLVLHKPVGVVSTVDDPQGRPTVIDLVDVPARVYPVGRLDVDSEGLLLLTDDGEMTHQLTHPRYEVEKEYRALLDKPLDPEAMRQWREGVLLSGEPTSPAWVDLLETTDEGPWFRIVLREGRKRQIRDVAHLLGYEVKRLIRVREGDLLLGDLPLRQWRPLTSEEIAALQAHVATRPRDAAPPASSSASSRPARPARADDRRDDDRAARPSRPDDRADRPSRPDDRADRPSRPDDRRDDDRADRPRSGGYAPRRDEGQGPRSGGSGGYPRRDEGQGPRSGGSGYGQGRDEGQRSRTGGVYGQRREEGSGTGGGYPRRDEGQGPRSGGSDSGPRRDEGRPIREGYSPFRSDRGRSDQGDASRGRNDDRDSRPRRPDSDSRPARPVDASPRPERPRPADASPRPERPRAPERSVRDDRPESRPEPRAETPPREPKDHTPGATRTRGAIFRSRPSGRPNFQIRPRPKDAEKE